MDTPQDMRKGAQTPGQDAPKEVPPLELAVKEAQSLLAFASRNGQSLAPEIVASVVDTAEALAVGPLPADGQVAFWAAFAKLAAMVKPATVYSVQITGTTRQPHFLARLIFRHSDSAEDVIIGQRFLFRLSVLIVVLIVLQWAGSFSLGLIDDIKASTKESSSLYQTAADNVKSAESEPTQVEKALLSLDNITPQLLMHDRSLLRKTELLTSIIPKWMLRVSKPGFVVADGTETVYTLSATKRERVDVSKQALEMHQWVQYYANDAVSQTHTLIASVNFTILPILYAAIGSLTFIVRELSEQVKLSSFTRATALRHTLRFALGVTAGLVVGLFTKGTEQTSLSPVALAFLAGYGADLVLRWFDMMVESFPQRRPPPVPEPPKTPAVAAVGA